MPTASAVVKDHVEVHELCSVDCKGEKASFAVALMSADSQFSMRGINLCDISQPVLPKSLDKKSLEETLKNCDKDTEIKLSTTKGFWQHYQ